VLGGDPLAVLVLGEGAAAEVGRQRHHLAITDEAAELRGEPDRLGDEHGGVSWEKWERWQRRAGAVHAGGEALVVGWLDERWSGGAAGDRERRRLDPAAEVGGGQAGEPVERRLEQGQAELGRRQRREQGLLAHHRVDDRQIGRWPVAVKPQDVPALVDRSPPEGDGVGGVSGGEDQGRHGVSRVGAQAGRRPHRDGPGEPVLTLMERAPSSRPYGHARLQLTHLAMPRPGAGVAAAARASPRPAPAALARWRGPRTAPQLRRRAAGRR
jgi:hypothetical protein